jgi:dipeptidyl aminopeptidase/acylaminoacyl peptidase
MVRRAFVVVFMAGMLMLVACQGGPKEVPQYTIEQFMNTTVVFGGSFSFDESKLLVTSDKSGVFNAYSIPVVGGAMTQVTNSDSNSIFGLSYFPEDDRVLYESDQGGNEVSHIYVSEADGSSQDVTPYDSARAQFYGWSHDLKSFYFGSNKRDKRFMDVYKMNIETFEPEMIYLNEDGYEFSAISPDERYIALINVVTTINTDMYLLDRETGQVKYLTEHTGDVYFQPLTFGTDSESLYYLTDADSEFKYLVRYDIATDESETVQKENWDIMYAYFSYNGKYRVVGINNDAKTEIQVYDTETDKQVQLPAMSDADITSVGISRNEDLMRFYVNGSRSPNNLYVFDFKRQKATKLTNSLSPEIKADNLVDAQIVRYKSFDSLEIPALFYKPHQVSEGSNAPAVVMVHGGPGGQATIGYSAMTQYLVNHGYVVIDVNNRGSSGYGKTFFAADDMKHGEDDLADVVAAKGYLASTGFVDTSKVAVLGGSYGGYIVLAALTFRPDAFAAGVDIFGISNWLRTLTSIPPWWESFRNALYKEMGNPETDEAYLRKISPLFHSENIKRPLMVLQGANDPRVLKVESDEIVAAAKENGVPVEYMVFDDEGHGFLKKENRIEGYSAIMTFLDTYLKGMPAPKPAEKSDTTGE